ncbi:hypothetical protein [Sphingomonas koreensis]
MIPAVSFLALSLAAGVQQAPSMVVTPAQLTAALGICRDQLGKPVFTDQELVAAGWPKAMIQESDGTAPAMRTYRHPENMLLLTLLDFPAKPDECIVMVPLGAQLNIQRITTIVTDFAGAKPVRGAVPVWHTDAADLQLESQGAIGARIIFTKKGR